MKKTLGVLALLVATKLSAQSGTVEHSVKAGPPKGDAEFTRTLATVLGSYGDDFTTLPRDFMMKDIVDSIWTVKLKLPGAGDERLNKSREVITLTEHFTLGSGSATLPGLVARINAALPDDFVYTLDYDAASKISNYTFFQKKSSKVPHPGYPDEIHLTGDLHSADLAIMKMR